MKIAIYTDTHFCTYSSILRTRGFKYSVRLENEIKSLNWAEKTAKEYNCNAVVCLGDFFDSNSLNAEELTALKDVNWNDLSHLFLVGNHEIGRHDCQLSSAHLLALVPNVTVVDRPMVCEINDFEEWCFIPYILNSDREPLSTYVGNNPNKKKIIFSHNDIKGLQMGSFLSQEGFDIEDINSNCELFINGHLHNHYKNGKIINVGNLTGQNFSEDALCYNHYLMILDTDTLKYEFVENPYALNFYKFDFTKLKNFKDAHKKLKENSVVVFNCKEEDYKEINELFSDVLACRGIVDREVKTESTFNLKDLNGLDHLLKFKEFVYANIGNNEIINSELDEVLK